MAEDHGVGIGEACAEPLQTPFGGACVVNHTQDYVFQLQGDRFGQLLSQLQAVDVAVDRDQRPELSQLGEDLRGAEVAGVDDQVSGAQPPQALLGQTTVAARQVGVGNQG